MYKHHTLYTHNIYLYDSLEPKWGGPLVLGWNFGLGATEEWKWLARPNVVLKSRVSGDGPAGRLGRLGSLVIQYL